MSLNSKQKPLCQLANTELLPQGDKEKSKIEKMTKARLGRMPQIRGSQFMQPRDVLFLSLMVTTAQAKGPFQDSKELKKN